MPFEKYASPLIKQLKDFNLKKIKQVATLDFGKVYTNWKFLIENFIEPYHVQIKGVKDLWWKVHKEDHEICERLQLGRSSPVSKNGGLLSPHWENSVRAFQQIMIKSMGKTKKNKKKVKNDR